jgi:hypothetical protein
MTLLVRWANPVNPHGKKRFDERKEEEVGKGKRDFVDSRGVEAWRYIIVGTR